MELFTKLTELLLNVPPFKIIFQNEGGILMRGGKYKKTLGPGFHWKWPVYDYIQKECVTEQIVNLPNQSLMTIDGRTLALSGTIKYQITDVRKALLEVLDYDVSLQNFAMSALGEYVSLSTDLKYSEICEEVRENISIEATDWGIEVLGFWLTDYAEHKVYRIMTLDVPTAILDE